MGIGSHHSKSLLEHDGLVHLTVPPPLPKSTRELCLLWCHWPRDLNVISDPSVLAFESLSFKYPAADLPGYRNLTPTLIPVHPRSFLLTEFHTLGTLVLTLPGPDNMEREKSSCFSG